MHEAFSKPDQISYVEHGCKTAGIGCIECKELLFKNLVGEIGPIQSRVKEIRAKPDIIIDALSSGATRCRTIAKEVMGEVRMKIGIKTELS
jgi:tryptophanyl-tRNA synthetase